MKTPVRIIAFACLLLMLPSVSGFQIHDGRLATNVTAIVQPDAPVSVDAFRTSAQSSTQEALLNNRTKVRVTAVELGWLTVAPTGDVVTSIGKPLSVVLEPLKLKTISGMQLPNAAPFAHRILLFVYTVRFADGTAWTADLSQLTRSALTNFSLRIRPARN